MNGKVLSLTVSTCVLIVLSGAFAYNCRGENVPANTPAKVIIQKIHPSNSQNTKKEFFIKKDNMNIIKMTGIQDKFGLTDPMPGSNNYIYTTLYIWGNEKEVLNKQLKIIAVNDKGDSIEISGLYRTTKEGHGDVTDKNTISTVRENISIRLSKGKWNFNIYLDNVLLGSAAMDINNCENKSVPQSLLQNG